MTNQRLVKRIEVLQSATNIQEQKNSGWSIWGSGSHTATKEEFERLTKALSIAEEELEAKINEN